MASSSAAATLSWLHSFGGTPRDTAKLLSDKRTFMAVVAQKKAKKSRKVKEDAQQLALMFQTFGVFKVKHKGGKGKQIFGTVTPQDLVDIIKAQLQRDVDKRNVLLPEIRETGEYIAELKLHPEVNAQVKLYVYAN